MSMRRRTRIAALAGREMAAKRGLVSSRSILNLTGDSGLKACSASVSTTSIMPLDQIASRWWCRAGPPRAPCCAAPPAEQHVDDRIDQARIDRGEAEIVPLLGLEHGQDRRQRDRIEIVAEAHRGDAVERDFDVVGSEIAQGGRHQPHQAVEHDLEHRQAFVGHHRRVDDGADAGIVVQRDVGQAETEHAVDFILIEDALGAAALGALESGAFVGHRRPLRGRLVAARRRNGLLGRRRGRGRLLFHRHAPFGGQRVLIDLVFRHRLRRY